MWTKNIEVSYPANYDERFVGEVAKMLEREGLLQHLYKIPEEDFRKKCFDALQQADSYMLKQAPGTLLAALPCADGSIRFACLLKAGITDCWVVITEQAENSPMRAVVNIMVEDLLAGRVMLEDYKL